MQYKESYIHLKKPSKLPDESKVWGLRATDPVEKADKCQETSSLFSCLQCCCLIANKIIKALIILYPCIYFSGSKNQEGNTF